MSLNQSMNISIGSMKNNQYALTVVSQNIANLNTEGYYKQRPDFVTNQYTNGNRNVIETIKGMNGASISSLTNYYDEAAFKNKLDSNSDANYYDTLADALEELEGIADDLGENGLNALLNDFFKASAQLEQFPTDSAIRHQYVNAAQTVCEKFNDISSKYNSLQTDKLQTIEQDVSIINSLLNNLASANSMHVKNGASSVTQTEINSILEELSNYVDITTTTNPNGSINLYIGDAAVVQGSEVEYTLISDFDSTNPNNPLSFGIKSVENPDHIVTNGINNAFSAGKLKAHVDFLNDTPNKTFYNVSDMKTLLDEAASSFAKAINDVQTQNTTYTDADGNEQSIFAAYIVTDPDTGELFLSKDNPRPMFVPDGVITADNIKVDSAFFNNPFLVSAAKIDTGKLEAGDDWTKAIGNSDNAVEITAIQNKNICEYNDGKGNAYNCTISQFLINNAAKNGTDLSNIRNKADVTQNIADMEATNYTNLIGVNLDEELADMIKYQRAFEASTRIFSTVNDLMGTIIGMV